RSSARLLRVSTGAQPRAGRHRDRRHRPRDGSREAAQVEAEPDQARLSRAGHGRGRGRAAPAGEAGRGEDQRDRGRRCRSGGAAVRNALLGRAARLQPGCEGDGGPLNGVPFALAVRSAGRPLGERYGPMPGSNIARTSDSPSNPGQYFRCSSMNSVAIRTASAFEATFRIAQPPTTSLVSVNGPSVTVILPLASRTRTPSAVGSRPP